MDYEDAFNISTIQLEPRLQEYMRRKTFNEENDIEPPISEEKEFCITHHDLRMIKRHNQGTKKLYTSKRLGRDPHFVKPDKNYFDESDSLHDFKKDPRYKRLQKKAQSHKDAQKQIRNFEGIDEDYTIFHESNPYDNKPQNRPQHISKPYDNPSAYINNRGYVQDNDQDNDQYDDSIMMDSRDFIQNQNSNNDNCRGKYCYSPNKTSKHENTYHHPPKIDYQQRLSQKAYSVNGGMEHSRDINDIIGNFDDYNRHLNRTYNYMHNDNNTSKYTGRRENASSYQSIPFGYGNGLPNISVEDSLKGGIRDSSKKSIGFRNPFENHFDYISKDISDSKHTVQMWPQSTRGQNREIARPHSVSAAHDRDMRKLTTSF